MKKQLLSAFIASSLILGPITLTGTAHASTAEIVKSVNFRDEPSLSGDQIRYLRTGETIDIIDQVNTYWYKVKDKNNKIGYVTTKDTYVKLLSPVTSESGTVNNANATVTYDVAFRTGPSTSNQRIRYLKKGERITILEKTNAYWYKVQDQSGQVGYASSSSKYIDPDTELVESPSKDAVSDANAKVIYGVAFRTGPSTSDKLIRYFKKGESLTILDQPSNYWYKVKDQNGNVGYVSSNKKYIETSYKITDNSEAFENTPTSVLAQKVIDAGLKYLGTPYEYGSDRSNTRTFDCSDFVRQAYLDGIGLSLPMDSRKQGQYVQSIGNTSTDWRDLKPGDLMFFMSYKGSKKSSYSGINKAEQRITHDGIYLGDGKILHTYSKESGGVKISSIADSHWEYRFIYGGSPIK